MSTAEDHEIVARSALKLGGGYAVYLPKKVVEGLGISRVAPRKNLIMISSVKDGIATIYLKKLDVAEIMEVVAA